VTRILPALCLVLFSLASFSYAAGANTSPKDLSIQSLLAREKVLNEKCQGKLGDSLERKKFCQEREKAASDLKKKGWCWGYLGQIEADKVWHECTDMSKLEKKSPYFIAIDAWECPVPRNLSDDHMYDKDSGCIPPLRKAPENIVVMDIEKEFAYVCKPFRYGKDFIEGFTAVFCNYVLASSLIDKNGQHPDLEKLKEYAGKQTMKAVKELR
jgi:hypothetical protein